MKTRTKRSFFVFPFGDYEGVRAYLNRQAASGWAFAGRYGLFTAKFQATQRKELCYDVVPADPRRSPQQLQQAVQHRQGQGWDPVDTLWGMDIYQSLPCQTPQLQRTEEDYRHWRRLFLSWFLWSLSFLGVTVLALLALAYLFQFHWGDLTYQWYRSDSRGMLALALPLGAVLSVCWLGWLLFCVLARCKPHRPCGTFSLFLRGGLQALGLILLGVTLAVLWLDQVPRLWMRLGLGLLVVLILLLSPLLAQGDRKRQTLLLGGGIFACLLLTMVLGWTVTPLAYDTYTDGSGWRESSQLSLLRAEDLDLDVEGQELSAFYSREEALLVCQENYHEHWSEGPTLELTTYTCSLPGLSGILWKDLVPQAAQRNGATATLSGDGWYQLWYREGNRVYHLSGTEDWAGDGRKEAVLALLTP